jgi:hypothetical protein
MNVYQFEDLIIGETMDPQLPAYIAIGDNIIKGTTSEFAAINRRVGNQHRRFARQSQVKESRQDAS